MKTCCWNTFLNFRCGYQMPEVFQDVDVTLIRADRVDPDGLCGDFNPQDDFKNVALQPGMEGMSSSSPLAGCVLTGHCGDPPRSRYRTCLGMLSLSSV